MKKIILLAIAIMGTVQLLAQQPATMIMKTTNGATIRTDVSQVDKIVFTDSTYNMVSSNIRLMEPSDLTWPDDRLIPYLLSPAATVWSLDMPAASLSDDERVMFCALQGLVNRSRPRIILYNHNEEAQNLWPNAHNLNTSAISNSSPYTLVKKFQSEVNGLVLYSTEKSSHYANLAVTIAGLDRLLPVTAEIKTKLENNGINLPVVTDLTTLTMTRTYQIYNYLYNNYWSRCNHRLLISERPNIPYVHDIGVASGSACVWLDPRTSSECNVLDKMLKDMVPGRDIVLGWYPEERSGVGEATKYGLTSVPADFFENTTVYSSFDKNVKIPTIPKRGKLENKVYAAIYISDGDNIQYCQHAMAKIFDQSGRGKMALNWTISPALVDFAPMMLNYYYSKANATNDCFVSGPSGLGYAMPYDAHNEVYYAASGDAAKFTPYAQLTQRYIEKAGLRAITVWDNISSTQRQVYADNCPYLYGLTINDWERQSGRLNMSVQSGWLPIAVQYPCYANTTDVITNFFNRDIKNFNGSAPMFVTGQGTVWDMGPDALIGLIDKLDALSPGNVKIVRADHWFSYYNEAHHLPFNLTMLQDMVVGSSAGRNNIKFATDGSHSEGHVWISKTAGQESYVTMNFKEPYQISRYVIRHAEASGMEPQYNSRDFTVETSLDGETWTTVGTHVGNTQPVTDVSITPVQAQYVRLTVTNPGADGLTRIANIEIYGAH